MVFVRMCADESLDSFARFGDLYVLDDLVGIVVAEIAVDDGEIVAVVADVEHVAVANGVAFYGCHTLIGGRRRAAEGLHTSMQNFGQCARL